MSTMDRGRKVDSPRGDLIFSNDDGIVVTDRKGRDHIYTGADIVAVYLYKGVFIIYGVWNSSEFPLGEWYSSGVFTDPLAIIPFSTDLEL